MRIKWEALLHDMMIDDLSTLLANKFQYEKIPPEFYV